MGIVDAFSREDRVEVKFSDFYRLMKQAAQYEIAMNAVNCDVPHAYIRETMTGKKEDHQEALAESILEAAEQEQENTEKEPPEITAESILEAAEETTCRG